MSELEILYIVLPLVAFGYGALAVLKSYNNEAAKIAKGIDAGKYRPEAKAR